PPSRRSAGRGPRCTPTPPWLRRRPEAPGRISPVLLVVAFVDPGRLDAGTYRERQALPRRHALLPRDDGACHDAERELGRDEPRPIDVRLEYRVDDPERG